jgi:hypothetical protein
MRDVTLVSGPPGSGKTSYVTAHAHEGDLIVDLDTIWTALSGQPIYDKPTNLFPYVIAARDAVLDLLSNGPNEVRAWVIATEPEAGKRREIQCHIRATSVIVLALNAEECIKRINADPRRDDMATWWKSIYKWWNCFSPNEGDIVQ